MDYGAYLKKADQPLTRPIDTGLTTLQFIGNSILAVGAITFIIFLAAYDDTENIYFYWLAVVCGGVGGIGFLLLLVDARPRKKYHQGPFDLPDDYPKAS